MSTDIINTTIRDSFVQNRTITVSRFQNAETLIPLRLTKSSDGGLTLIVETIRGSVKPIDVKEIDSVIINKDDVVPLRVQQNKLYQASKTLEDESIIKLSYNKLPSDKQDEINLIEGVDASNIYSPIVATKVEPIPLEIPVKNSTNSGWYVLLVSGLAIALFIGVNIFGSVLIR